MNETRIAQRHGVAASAGRLLRRAVIALCGAVVVIGLPATAQAAKFSALGYTAPVSPQWQAQAPSSQYRLAQYRVAGRDGDAELVVFYFGKGQGGSVAANIQRWTSQFTTADGRAVAPKTEVLKVGDLPVTLVELNGSYARGVGSGPQGEPRPGQTLLVAIVETIAGNITIQLFGPRSTVAAERRHFDSLVRGFRRDG